VVVASDDKGRKMIDSDFTASAAKLNAETDGDPVFRPSAFWAELNEKNIAWLNEQGLDACRRTVSMNYFNWMVTNPRHPLFRSALVDWIRHPSFAPLRARIEDDVSIRVYTRERPMHLTWVQRQIYKLFVAMVWDQMLRSDTLGLAAKIEEPIVGDPVKIYHHGRLIAHDLCSAISEANVLLPLVHQQRRPRFCEVGAGYGRLAYVVSKARSAQYCMFDIAPALQVSQWYLNRVLPGRRLFNFRHFDRFDEIANELSEADAAFFTPNQLRLFPDGYFDVAVSISTFPELTREQVDVFLSLMQRTASSYIFLKQWYRWRNDKDGTDLTVDSYQLDPEWVRVTYETDPLVPMFFNAIWKRDK
jgi:putative sugar O-methyltransferase